MWYKSPFRTEKEASFKVDLHKELWYDFGLGRGGDKTPAEIDFVIQTEHRVIQVEVKAEKNVRACPMSEYIKNHPDYQLKGLRISMMGYQDLEWMENIPLFVIAKFFG